MLLDAGRPPRIVEIGHVPFIRQAFPETTEFYSTWPDALAVRGERGCHLVSLAILPQLAGRLADPALDLIVVHAPAFSPWSGRALVRSLFRRSILTGNIALFRGFATELLRRPPAAPVAILDFDDANTVARCNLFLLDRATLYFKRELPADHWLVFAGTLHWRVPTPRFRALKQNRTRIAKLRPISLGASPAAVMRMEPLPMPCEKTIDVFFAGRLGAAATVRERGFESSGNCSGKPLRSMWPNEFCRPTNICRGARVPTSPGRLRGMAGSVSEPMKRRYAARLRCATAQGSNCTVPWPMAFTPSITM